MVKLLVVLTFFGSIAWARVDIKDTVPVAFPRLFDDPRAAGDPKSAHAPVRAPQAINSQQWLENTALVKGARELDEKMKAKIVMGTEEKVSHEFSAKISTVEAKAQMVYKGWTHAEMVYQSQGSEAGIEISEKFFSDKEFVLGHYTNPTRSLSSVGIRWSWK